MSIIVSHLLPLVAPSNHVLVGDNKLISHFWYVLRRYTHFGWIKVLELQMPSLFLFRYLLLPLATTF